MCIELYAVEVYGLASYVRAEPVRPEFEVGIGVIAFEHSSPLLRRKVMLWF